MTTELVAGATTAEDLAVRGEEVTEPGPEIDRWLRNVSLVA